MAPSAGGDGAEHQVEARHRGRRQALGQRGGLAQLEGQALEHAGGDGGDDFFDVGSGGC